MIIRSKGAYFVAETVTEKKYFLSTLISHYFSINLLHTYLHFMPYNSSGITNTNYWPRKNVTQINRVMIIEILYLLSLVFEFINVPLYLSCNNNFNIRSYMIFSKIYRIVYK